ncbi:MAG: M20/M25/M40 family metallo-hydrolase [Saprospiraceae bacterium]|nr:M20/M25/M40 family metallo-hydrolase [Saprospiraceae bacterium]
MRFSFSVTLCLFTQLFYAQINSERTHLAIDELTSFISIPNFGLNEEDIIKNIRWLETAFDKRGFTTQRLKTTGNPLLLAERQKDPSLPTILFYMHLDGQAVDPGKWDQKDPYHAVIKQQNKNGEWEKVDITNQREIDPESRIFGRSASDDKGPIIAFLNAIDQTSANQIKHNIKVILDGEEEIGSKPLAAAVVKYRELLSADALIINDGPVHTSGKPTLTFGCRGIMTLNMTVYGPIKPQHSGHYGNYAPNPIFNLAELLASMKDEKGRVTIEGYYDGISLDEETKKILSTVPDDIETIHGLLQIAEPEEVGKNYQESLQYPSLNARGISSAWIGAQARTIVPDNATVALDTRLVTESDPDHLIQAIRTHIKKQGFHIVDHEPTREERMKYSKLLYFYNSGATLPFRTDMNTPIGNWLEKVVKKTMEEDPVKIRIMGGTVPIAAFINELNLPAVIVPMVNPDNNQHSPNENLRIGHFQYAMKMFEGILTTEMN